MKFGSGDVVIELAAPTDLSEVISLYRSVGWTVYADAPEVLDAALSGSARVVVACRDGALVGLARVVSDGAPPASYKMFSFIWKHSGLVSAAVSLQPSHRSVKRSCSRTMARPTSSLRITRYSETRDFGPGTLGALVRFDD